MNDIERERWVNNNEDLYQSWKRTKLPIRPFLRIHRAAIDTAIEQALNRCDEHNDRAKSQSK